MRNTWLIVCSLALALAGCAEAAFSNASARVIEVGQVPPDVAPPQDGATDGAADAPTDTVADVVTNDVPGDQLGDADVSDAADASSDQADVALSDVADAPDVIPPTDTGVDGGTDVLDAADVADVQTDRVDVVLIDAADVTDVPVPTDTGVDAGSDSDTGSDVIDVPTDMDVCPVGLTRCGATCVNTQTENLNCGACSNACAALFTCQVGVCVPTSTADAGSPCGTGTTSCGGVCRNLATDAMNCGACGITCAPLANATTTCTAGTCSVGVCSAGFGDCDGNPTNGCEVDLLSTATRCGTCSRSCTFANATATCAAGACTIGACNSNFANCDGNPTNGCEVDVRVTRTHCGACGRICTFANAAATCSAGACVMGTCNPGYGNCDGNVANGCEQSVNADPRNCGACGNVCASGVCEAGTCLPSPTLDIALANMSIMGAWVRSANYNAPNAVGDWVWRPCSASSPARACRIDVRRLTAPGTSTAVVSWRNEWGFEIVAATSMTSPLCALTDPSCTLCGPGFTSCLTVTCVVGGLVPDGNPRYENAYGTVRPPGMGSGAFYAWRIGFLFPIRALCPSAS